MPPCSCALPAVRLHVYARARRVDVAALHVSHTEQDARGSSHATVGRSRSSSTFASSIDDKATQTNARAEPDQHERSLPRLSYHARKLRDVEQSNRSEWASQACYKRTQNSSIFGKLLLKIVWLYPVEILVLNSKANSIMELYTTRATRQADRHALCEKPASFHAKEGDSGTHRCGLRKGETVSMPLCKL